MESILNFLYDYWVISRNKVIDVLVIIGSNIFPQIGTFSFYMVCGFYLFLVSLCLNNYNIGNENDNLNKSESDKNKIDFDKLSEAPKTLEDQENERKEILKRKLEAEQVLKKYFIKNKSD